VFHVPHLLGEWLEPVTAPAHALLTRNGPIATLSHGTEIGLLCLGAIIAVVFAIGGWQRYREGTAADDAIAEKQPALARFLEGAWGIDRAYQRLVVQPMKLVAFALAVVIDQFAIDGLVNGAASLALSTSQRVRRMASGSIASYSLWMGAATALLVIVVLWQMGG
jgi:NADH:ubiquinone oxidoreductase subunit 5 (subunit L)/multisubunit Na+/H+ antiporter MnhA subunit